MKNGRIGMAFFVLLCFICTGCGNTPQPATVGTTEPETYLDISERVKQKGSYVIEELGLEDPNICIYKEAGEDVKLHPKDFALSGGILSRVIETSDEDNGNFRIFLQKLEAPYKEWKVTELDTQFTEADTEYDVRDYLCFQGKPVYAVLSIYQETTKSFDDYLANCDEEGKVLSVLGAIPKSMSTYELKVGASGCIYAYHCMEGDNSVIVLTPDMQVTKEVKLLRTLQGIFEDETNNIVYLMEQNTEGFSIYNLENELIVQDSEKLNSYYYDADVLSDGSILASDTQKLWLCKKGKTPELMCNYLLNNYVFENVYALDVQEDDTALVLVQFEGKLCLIRVLPGKQEAQGEKQEIIIAFGYPHIAMAASINRFNRQSDQYTITAIVKEDQETFEDFSRDMQFAISAGKGPDILADSCFYSGVDGYIQNGYFANLDDVLDSIDPYVASAFEGGKSEGVLYGMPYDFSLNFVTYSQNFTG